MNARAFRCAQVTFVLTIPLALALGGGGCLDRPVVAGEPTTKTDFTHKVAQAAVDKIDILFSIDNSASMGDKQAYLERAIPDLIARLITPNCVNASDESKLDGPSIPGPDGTATCSAYLATDPASQLEFPAVHDMHIGVVSSSLGSRLGDKFGTGKGGQCLTKEQDTSAGQVNSTITINGTTLDRHHDDQAHLLTRSDPTTGVTGTPSEVPLADAPSGFLAWYPTSNGGDAGAGVTPVTSGGKLTSDFADLIAGVHEYGCGIESQLESWYRFLIQPDPYASLAVQNGKGSWVGVDTTILKQRHDFLRPDSLVAVIVLTDENDSEIDVRSIGGEGYYFMSTEFTPPHGTAACAANPADPGCTTLGMGDPSPYRGATDWGYDLNLRHVHMKAKYGVDPQYPIARYENGLTSASVPDRAGEYPSGANAYVGTNDCTNPLFAASLPDGSGLSASVATAETPSDATSLCNLPKSTVRSKSLVFYAVIGGVPWQLLHFDPTSAKSSELSTCASLGLPSGCREADWTRILGANPDAYDYTGIDPHMVESSQPRSAVPGYSLLPALGGNGGVSPAETNPAAANGPSSDPYNGREWVTDSVDSRGAPLHVDLAVDREYACTFELVDETGAPAPRDCSKNSAGAYNVPANGEACDCSSTGLAADQLSPLCDPARVTSQTHAKAYPTIRELNLANKLGAQGIVSSICPIHVADNAAKDDPLYGYRPAVASIVGRLKSALTPQCLPQPLRASDAAGTLPCLILATLPSGTQADCSNPAKGFEQPDPGLLADLQKSAHDAWLEGGGTASGAPDPATLPTCQVARLTSAALDANGSCRTSSDKGWCYVTGAAAGACAQAIVFSPQTIPASTTVNLQCIETASALAAGTSPDGG
jgi:hypothetical protein